MTQESRLWSPLPCSPWDDLLESRRFVFFLSQLLIQKGGEGGLPESRCGLMMNNDLLVFSPLVKSRGKDSVPRIRDYLGNHGLFGTAHVDDTREVEEGVQRLGSRRGG